MEARGRVGTYALIIFNPGMVSFWNGFDQRLIQITEFKPRVDRSSSASQPTSYTKEKNYSVQSSSDQICNSASRHTLSSLRIYLAAG
jgi:hypothetical protein